MWPPSSEIGRRNAVVVIVIVSTRCTHMLVTVEFLCWSVISINFEDGEIRACHNLSLVPYSARILEMPEHYCTHKAILVKFGLCSCHASDNTSW